MDNVTITKLTMSAVAGAIAAAFQWYSVVLAIFVISVLLDYGTGMAKAYFKKEISSEIGFKGILKKLLYFAIIACGFVTDFLLNSGLSFLGTTLPYTGGVGVITTIWLILNELTSIIENLGEIDGVPIPAFLRNSIKRLRELADKDDLE